jgi:hypothetical protein
MSDTPHRLARNASLPNLSRSSPARTSSVAAWCAKGPAMRRALGPPRPRANSTGHPARRSPPRGPHCGGPQSANLVAPRRRDRHRGASGRRFPPTLAPRGCAIAGEARPARATRMACNWFAAWARAFTAERLAAFKVRIISTQPPQALLGSPAASPESTAQAVAPGIV